MIPPRPGHLNKTDPIFDDSDRKGLQPRTRIFVAVDACAELGGQPYNVLRALKDLYAISKRRTLTVIDSEHGLHEKANVSARHLISALGKQPSLFSNFIEANADWINIIQTATCRKFKRTLAEHIFPEMVAPMITLAEEISNEIRAKAFETLKQNDISEYKGKTISSADDIDLDITFNKKHHYVIEDRVLNEAANAALKSWKAKILQIDPINKNSSEISKKGYMLGIIKSMQEVKAYMHTLASNFCPEIANSMGTTPAALAGQKLTQSLLSKHSALYANMPLTPIPNIWQRPEAIQAVRLTALWPWAQKCTLKSSAKGKLDACHYNTGDISYLDLFTNELPDQANPKESLFILLTHDAPLQGQLLECATGIKHRKAKIKSEKKGEGGKKRDVYEQSDIYAQYNLAQRKHGEYPAEAALVGSEFIEFVYKEVLATIGQHLTKGGKKFIREEIEQNSPGSPNQAGRHLLDAIDSVQGITQDLRDAMRLVVTETQNLEMYVKRDIQAYGKAEGRYAARHGKYTSLARELKQMRENGDDSPLIIS